MQTAQKHNGYAFSGGPTNRHTKPQLARPILCLVPSSKTARKPTEQELRAMYPEPGGRA